MKIYYLNAANAVRIFDNARDLIDLLEESNTHINDIVDMVNNRQNDRVPTCTNVFKPNDEPQYTEINEWHGFHAESCTYEYMPIKDVIAYRNKQWPGSDSITKLDIENWCDRIKRWASADLKQNSNTISSIKANKPVKSSYICLVEKLGEYKYSIKTAYHEDVFCTTCIRHIGTGQSMARHVNTNGHIKVAKNCKAQDDGMVEINPSSYKTLSGVDIIGVCIPIKYKYMMPKWAVTAYDLYKKNNRFGKMSLAEYMKTIKDDQQI